MNILFITHSPLHPVASGVVRRNVHMFREAAREHGVSVLMLGSGHDHDGFLRTHGSSAHMVVTVDVRNVGWRRVLRVCLYVLTGMPWVRHWHRRKVQNAIDAMCAQIRPDIIHLTTPLLRLYRFPSYARVVADAHNVEHDNLLRVARESSDPFRKLLFFAFAWRLRTEEARTAGMVDLLLAVSERDRMLFHVLAPHARIAIVPNGVDPDEFTPGVGDRKRHALVFVGTMSYQPNDAGIRHFLQYTFPLVQRAVPDATLTIVGADPSPAVRAAASAAVSVTGVVPDVRPYLSGAEVLIVPLGAGGGTRLKILEAMAQGIPAVSTTIGCEGLNVRHGEHLLVADTPVEFARAVVRLLQDRALRERLAANALALVRKGYAWSRVGEDLRAHYRGLTGPARDGSSPVPVPIPVPTDGVLP